MNSNSAWWLPSKDQETRRKFENEYIRREFGLTLFSGIEENEKQLKAAKSRKYALVFVDTSVNNLKALNRFPKRSVALFTLSDESYKFIFNLRNLLNPRIAMIIRDYPIGENGNIARIPRLFFQKIRRLRKYPDLVGLSWITIASGVYLCFSQIVLFIFSKIVRKSVHNIPLGYDSGFANRYCEHFDLDINQSLLAFAINSKPGNFRKDIDLLFVGQKGKLDRQLLIREAESLTLDSQHRILIKKNENYEDGRDMSNQKNYFELLARTKYSLCPPGNYSGQTFRYYESLLTFAYPLQDNYIFSDPLSKSSMNYLWTNILVLGNAFCSLKYLDKVLELNNRLQDWKNQISYVLTVLKLNE